MYVHPPNYPAGDIEAFTQKIHTQTLFQLILQLIMLELKPFLLAL
jgi:hypothetical protein